MTDRRGRIDGIALLILLAAFVLRLWHLGADSLWYDETVTLFLAQEDVPRLVAHTAGDIHPPLYYLLQHLWLAVAGASAFSAAFFSLFFGVLLVALAYRLARGLTGNALVARLAALLVACSSYNLWYSQEVRMYTLGAALGMAAAWVLWRWLREAVFHMDDVGHTRHLTPTDTGTAGMETRPTESRRTGPRLGLGWLSAYAILAALGLYTLYYFAFLLVFLALFGLAVLTRLSRPRRQATRWVLAWGAAQVATLALFAPWLPVAIRQATVPPVPPWRSFTPLGQVLVESWTALSVGQSLHVNQAWVWLVGCGLLVAATGVVLVWRGQGHAAAFLVGYTAFPLLAIYAASTITPLYHPRYLFTYSTPFYVLLAVGLGALSTWGKKSLPSGETRRPARLAKLGRQGLLPVGLAVLLLGDAWSAWRFETLPAYRADDHRGAVAYLEQHLRPGDVVLVNAGDVYTALLAYHQEPVAWRGRLTSYAGVNVPAEGLVLLEAGSLGGAPTLGWGDPQSDFYPTTAAETRAALEKVFRQHPRVWVYRCYDTVTDPQGLIRASLEELGKRFDDQVFAGESNLRVQGYVSRLVQTAPAGKQEIAFGSRALLESVEARPAEGDRRRVWAWLNWQKLEATPRDWAVSLRLYDGAGNRLAQADEVPLGPLFGPSHWGPGQVVVQPMRLDLPPGTPPGTYELRVTVYDSGAGNAPFLTPTGQDEAPVGRVVLQTADQEPAPTDRAAAVGAHFAGVELIDVHLSTTEPAPGSLLQLELLWKKSASGADGETPILFIQVLDEAGASPGSPGSQAMRVAQEAPLGWPNHLSLGWQSGELVRTRHTLRLPADTPSGAYLLVVGLLDPKDRSRLRATVRPGLSVDHLQLATLAVVGRQPNLAPVAAFRQPAHVVFGQAIELLDYQVEPQTLHSLHSVDVLEASFHWRATAVMEVDYQVFLHLTPHGDGRPVAQADQPPLGGQLPTARWLPGEILEDAATLAIPADLPPGPYDVRVGFYDPQTGPRLAVAGPDGASLGDHFDLGSVVVEAQ